MKSGKLRNTHLLRPEAGFFGAGDFIKREKIVAKRLSFVPEAQRGELEKGGGIRHFRKVPALQQDHRAVDFWRGAKGIAWDLEQDFRPRMDLSLDAQIAKI